jgi:hypothetical protein
MTLPCLPRPRTLVHPGPARPVRIEHLHAASGRHVRVALAPGRSLHDALVEPLLALGMPCASLTILGGRMERLHYCVAAPDPSGTRVAMYGSPRDAGAATLIFGNATLGRDARGEPMVHCHATCVRADGEVRGGHSVVDRSFAAEGLAALAISLDGFELRIAVDEETRMPLMRPVAHARRAPTTREAARAV